MTTPTLTYTYGPSGSGKSKWARAQWARDNSIVLVSRDELRLLLHGGKWSKANEKYVVAVQDEIIRTALQDDHSVIVHDTNLHPSNLGRFQAVAAQAMHYRMSNFGKGGVIKVVCQDFSDVDMATCIKRDLERGKAHGVVGHEVIERQFRDYLTPAPAAPEPYHKGLPTAIIVDMDGTLALNPEGPMHRSFYDETGLCINDKPNDPVVDLVRQISEDGSTHVLICSGRFDTDMNRSATGEWLECQGIYPEAVYMRPAGDQRKDNVIKSEIYEGSIRGKFNIRFVLDDRQQVVDFWRSVGLTCLQVAPGQF